ncbi:Na+/H+ antiporter NhaC family protein [Vibrio sp. EJY3]|uniref:Na+/H+ antiporter NhaC family protein n=1 Tax=Vibrio sp. (strain EJY3) TaxID=1116375 RepID=UPI000243B8B5|nr:Na+/H+ antiporter NhaC family protein [Vibrio sp. EJY3]AEX24913.1 Na+/H+ antiporter NhaC [Vibrio sp. EJY3]
MEDTMPRVFFRTTQMPWLITLLCMSLVAIASHYFFSGGDDFGAASLLPSTIVICLALVTKRTLEPLIAGSIAGFLIISPTSAIQDFTGAALEVMQGPVMGWILLLTGLFGGLIALLHLSGGTLAFSEQLQKHIHSRRQALFASWILGLLIFIDDYLNALTVSAAMKNVTDKLKISREMLAYIVDSTSAPVCLLVPFSTWVIYISGLLEANNVTGAGDGITYYFSLIPYLIYPWIAVAIIPIVAMGIIPPLGAMKKAEANQVTPKEEVQKDAPSNPKVMNFILPIVILITATWYFDIDALIGVGCALAACFLLYTLQGIATFSRLFDEMMRGLQNMLVPIGIVFTAFILQIVNEKLGLTSFIISTVTPYMTASWLPAITFVVLSILTFSTGSFWGIYAVSFPIIVPLATALDANLPLTLGALISAGAFGSHACFFGDSTVIAAKGCGISPVQHAITQLPYTLIAAAASSALFVILA